MTVSPRASEVGEDVGAQFDMKTVGPHPGFVELSRKFLFEHQIQAYLKRVGLQVTAEERFRMQGVSLIEQVRIALGL
jgi:hypothetical protein